MIREAGTPTDELTALFAAEYPGMVGMATLLLRDRAAAEDVVQEGFARVIARWDKIRGGPNPAGYLRATVVNAARSRGRRLQVADKPHRAAAFQSTPASPEEHALAGAEQTRVLAALATLPDRQRECAVLRYYLDLSDTEIAEALDLAPGSVKSHLHRARQALSQALEER